ncbi:MAG: M20/M25/M40 family metallo-hydrolase, partial [Bacteroidetes bacterium]|nr:M20/M25/M40 family metallo-hydrolase [Bacteroidota bacterium]
MSTKIALFTFFSCIILASNAQQTNIQVSNVTADKILKGDFDPLIYAPAFPVLNPQTIFQSIESSIKSDSLKASIIKLASFKNRNSGSDTVSATEGFGAARNWVYDRFTAYSAANQNRLIPAFLTFEQNICSVTKHKNIMAVLPGSDTSNHQIIVIEGHMDSRCEDLCDVNCIAEGVEDNATGTALVMELARIMSKYSFKHTIVFLVTTAEEQGLFGANAFATYALSNQLPIKAVFNNDVIGGVICGQTSSGPSCPGLNDVDSTQVRLFSFGSNNSAHKQLARYVKLEYDEELKPIVSVPMMVTVMSAEDRTGRGGDHIPFRQKGYPALRFTSANEHGDASNGPGYTDRQHTSSDNLGVDTNNDLEIDSFFVDFNYLGRNASINGLAASAAAWGVPTPKFTTTGINDVNNFRFVVDIEQLPGIQKNRVAVRTLSNDWDTVVMVNGNYIEIQPAKLAVNYYVSVAASDDFGVESLFSPEKTLNRNNLAL